MQEFRQKFCGQFRFNESKRFSDADDKNMKTQLVRRIESHGFDFNKVKNHFNCARGFAFSWRKNQNHFVKQKWKELKRLALGEIEATLEGLPRPLRGQAQRLPVTFERVPNAGLQADGIESDTLGLFTGSEFADEGASVMPPQIILFLENLWDFAEGDEEVFCDEVHTTFLHELGHFFGLDEDDLTERGLD